MKKLGVRLLRVVWRHLVRAWDWCLDNAVEILQRLLTGL